MPEATSGVPWQDAADNPDVVISEQLDQALVDPDVVRGLESIYDFREPATRKARVREALVGERSTIRSAAQQEEQYYRASIPRQQRTGNAPARRFDVLTWVLFGIASTAAVGGALYLLARLLFDQWLLIVAAMVVGAVLVGVVMWLGVKKSDLMAFFVAVALVGAGSLYTLTSVLGNFWLSAGITVIVLAGMFAALAATAPGTGEPSSMIEGSSVASMPELTWEERTQAAVVAFDVWRSALYARGVMPALLTLINSRTAEQFSVELRYRSENLSRTAGDLDLHQRTPAGAQLAEYFRTLHSGSFALSGPRGAGKTALMNAFCRGTYNETPREDLVISVAAPVDYVPKDFMLHLYASLCGAVISYVKVQLPDVDEEVERTTYPQLWFRRRQRRTTPLSPGTELLLLALRRQRWIRYLQTVQGEMSGKIGFSGNEIAMKTAISNAEQAHTFPEIVAQLRKDLVTVAAALGPASRVIICVDELDRIQNADRAVGFVNEIKAIFRVPNCYCLVSVSEDALHDFELAAMGVRTAMDSAFDEVLWVDYLDMELARLLLGNYVVGLSQQYLAFAYVRSGGLARQLVRTARELIDRADRDPGSSMSTVVESLLYKDLRRTTEAVKGSLVNVSDRAAVAALVRALDTMPVVPTESTLYDYAVTLAQCPVGEDVRARDLRDTMTAQALYLSTLAGVFRDDLDEERMRTATNPGGSFDALARVRRYVGMNPQAALALLDDFRPWWGLRKLG